MNEKHIKIKRLLRLSGILCLIAGIIFVVLGAISWSQDEFTVPWKFFIGLPLIPFGAILIVISFNREISTYFKNESVPVMKETYNDMHPVVKDIVATAKGENTSSKVCPHCGEKNDSDSNFCKKCGKPIGNKICKNCGQALNDEAKFCPSCGKEVK